MEQTHSFFETHCHLDYLKSLPMEEIIQKSQDEGVRKFITVCVSPDNFDKVIEISKKYVGTVYCSQGIHPHEAKLFTDSIGKTILENALNNSDVVKAIGEIGLDYHYDNSPRDAQREAFEKQLELAVKTNLPVIIHSRDADSDTISILKNFLPTLSKKGVIHSFTGSKELAEFAIQNEFYLGFNGIITFKKAESVRDIVKITPIESILFETDCPFLTPVPHRGKENAPHYIPLIAQKVAEIKNIAAEDLFKIVYTNSLKLFNIK